MNKNTTIKIGSTKVKIRYKELDDDTEYFCRGLYDRVNHIIWVNTNQTQAEIDEALLHETLHAICNIYGIEANMDEEVLVRIYTNALQQAGYKK